MLAMSEGRILLFSDIFPPKTGGSGRWFREIYSRLPRDRVIVAAGEVLGADELDRSLGMDLVRLPIEMRTRGLRPFGNLKHYVKLAWRVRRLVKGERVTMIHAARNLPEGFVAYLVRRMRGTPYLCYVHGEDVAVSAASRELAWMTRRVFAGATLVIANSRNTRAMLLDEWRLPEAKARLLYPGVDTKRFVPADPDDSVRRELGWAGRRVLLTVGRLQQRKGHDMLIRALPSIRERHPDVLYAILGDGEERAGLEALAEQDGVKSCVRFHGEVGDDTLLRAYQQCDLFVLPNRQVGRDIEGFGMVLLEAQACGRPVVAGASGGTAETMKVPETGRVVACETPGPLADTISDLLDDPVRLTEMGRRGREWVVERFDWDALAVEAQQLFRECVRTS
jgi:phosphatidyl-myo-inositol dimannoside synthase